MATFPAAPELLCSTQNPGRDRTPMDIGIAPTAITLDSRFADLDRPVLLTGIQALLRLLLEQRRLDQEAGLNTAALVSGYRGSPLGGLDRELWAQKTLMQEHA